MSNSDRSTRVPNAMDAATEPCLTENTIEALGLTLLANGGPNIPLDDVIFIHGLQGHPEDTWSYTSKIRSELNEFRRFI